jgi:WD40 repeat protein
MSTYDAFISYSHSEGGEIAGRLQERIERFAKPWYRTRSSRVFLDANSLTADPKLWQSIEDALADSDWLILVTSPEAAGSHWVNREIDWWLKHRSVEQVILVLASGELHWDEAAGDFDPRRSTAMPGALRGAFEEEPLWVSATDLTAAEQPPSDRDFDGVVADIAAPIRGVPKERLVAAAEREHRRTMRWVRGTIAVLLLMLAAAIVAGVIAFHERGSAEGEAQVALSRQLASTSEALAGSNLDASMLLAVQAFRVDPNQQTRTALLDADTSSPNLVRFIEAPAHISQIAAAADGRSVVAGLGDGRVMIWPTSGGSGRELFHLPHHIISLAVDADGSVVAASDGVQAMLWRVGAQPRELPLPSAQNAHKVGLSPSGRTVVYASGRPLDSEAAWFARHEAITVADTADPDSGVVHRGLAGEAIDVPSDRRALLFAAGAWEWKSFATWTGIKSTVGIGAHDLSVTTSADGRFVSETNGDSTIPVWSTEREYHSPSEATPSGSIEAALPSQKLVALSPDGSRMAVAGPGEIYDAAVRAPGKAGELQAEEEQIDLEGSAKILSGQSASLVSFANDSQLVSVAGKEIAIWRTTRLDRLERTQVVPLGWSCEECGPPEISISPNGDRAAVLNGDGSFAFVVSLRGDHRLERLPSGFNYGSPIWEGSGDTAYFPVWLTGGPDPDLPSSDELPEGVRLAAFRDSYDAPVWDAAYSGAKGEMIAVDRDGRVRLDDVTTGKVAETSAAEFKPESDDADYSATVNADGTLLALGQADGIKVEELPSRNVVNLIDAGEFTTALYADSHLLVQAPNGEIEVWDERGDHLERTIAGNGATSLLAAGHEGELLAGWTGEGTIALEDIADGARIATFATRADSGFFESGLAISPDEQTLYSIAEEPGGVEKAELVERDFSDPTLVRAACEAAGHTMSAAEWRSLVVGIEPPDEPACH